MCVRLRSIFEPQMTAKMITQNVPDISTVSLSMYDQVRWTILNSHFTILFIFIVVCDRGRCSNRTQFRLSSIESVYRPYEQESENFRVGSIRGFD